MRIMGNVELLTLGLCIFGVLDIGKSDNSPWDVCKMNPERGTKCLDKWKVKWFYNHSIDGCDRFWYGGCGGNGNQFENKTECESFCKVDKSGTENIVITEDDSKTGNVNPVVNTDMCKQNSSQGTCRDFEVNWFYNYTSSHCERFWYGGCDGNDNRFKDEQECNHSCIGTQTVTKTEDDVCKQPTVTGRCRARHIRWFYNSNRKECIQFVYGGCGGNGNRFRTRNDCERQCLSGTSALGDERESGCRNSRFGCCPDGLATALGNNNEGCSNACQLTRFGCCDDDLTAAQGPNLDGCDDIEIGSGDVPCDQSEYGCCPDGTTAATGPRDAGCDIFVDSSEPDTDSDDITVDGTDDKITAEQCQLAKNTGPCSDYVVMWYYNTKEHKCDRFWFGGCEGNTNRFKSEKECLTTCQSIIVKEPKPEVTACQQPKEIGPCRAALPRWFHNSRTRACEQFFYGGCHGNDNNFETQDLCERDCGVIVETPLTAKEICAQPQDIGPCRASVQRYFYNMETKRCELFTYGGCGGNRNNFETDTKCRQYCHAEVPRTPHTTRTQPVCELTPAVGPCDRMVTKYHYNISTLQCESFTYGGCLGNHNNFETEEKCMSYCGLRSTGGGQGFSSDDCRLTHEAGSCRGNIRRHYYDAEKGRCFPFTYGGCQGNRNNFAEDKNCMEACRAVRDVVPDRVTRPPAQDKPGYCPLIAKDSVSTCHVECSKDSACNGNLKCCRNTCGAVCTNSLADDPHRQVSDVCSLPLQQTPCSSRDSGWYYDKSLGLCKEVPDMECNGNQNHFRSQTECEAYCSKERVCRPLTYKSDIRCLAYFEQWTYNADTDACEMFVYGGCGGTSNNFASEDACNHKCLGEIVNPVTIAPQPTSAEEVCAMTEESGNCLAYIRNWRYDSLAGHCIQFTYGGCGGNTNNFESREQCERFCTREVVCQKFEDPEVGCLAYMRRWQYQPSTGKCENFIYGGCGGNANNFETMEACDEKCVGRERERDQDNRVDNRMSSWREICRLQADVGPCKQYVKKWHYNGITQDCEEFSYGGCLGNHNNFQSSVQCMTYCDSTRWGPRREPATTTAEPENIEESSGEIPTSEPATGVDVCHLDRYTGRCRAYIRSWYHDHLTGGCKQFIYGGCDTNGNRFDTQEECETQCSPRAVCLLPESAGNCMAYMPNYFFDYSAQECKEFIYGGCHGNANNFKTKEACERRCDPLMRDRIPDTVKRGSCPTLRRVSRHGRCIEQCRKDRDCPGTKKCCVIACSLVCVEPAAREIINRIVDKVGYCPPQTDWQGILGACAPSCRDHSSCPGNEKCCMHGCGLRCIIPVGEEPYQMSTPTDITVPTMSSDTIHISWYDPSLGRDQRISDRRYYTIRYYSYGLGQYEYMNVTDTHAHVRGLRPDTEYEFNVRVNNPPYLSEWSENARNRTTQRVIVKQGQCPVLADDTFGICLEDCQDDSDCSGVQKCCHNGCGQTCVEPLGVHDYKPGFCPPRTDWEGLLGACAPTCRDDSSCPGNEKCCHHGCGFRCIESVGEEPYQMNTPIRIWTSTVSPDTIRLTWYDPSLGRDQLIRDNRYYTIRYYSYDIGQYEYTNVTELRAHVTGLRPNTEYTFSIRVNDPPYLSKWSDDVKNSTSTRSDNLCSLPKDPGTCSDWEVRWFFNTEIQRCDRFWFGGCNQGNANNFLNENECLSQCKETQITTTPYERTARPYNCRRTTMGCCLDRYTPRLDERGSNCAEYDDGIREKISETIVPAIPGQGVTVTCHHGNNVTWYREGKLVKSNSRRRVNTDGSIEVFSATIEDDGIYACHVMGNNGRPTIYQYVLQVQVPIGILPGPDKFMVKPNRQAFLHCEVYGNPTPSVTWQKGSMAIRSEERYETFINGTLLIRRATEHDIASYTCTADNGVSTPVERTVSLELREMLVARIENDNGRVMEGGRMKLSCSGHGYPVPTLTWEKMGRSLTTGGNVYISEDGQLTIRDVMIRDTGTYSCIVANSEEKIETSTSVQVVPKVMPDDKCEDKTARMKCRLIVTARLCGYAMYSKICCSSCRRHFNGE